MRVFLFKDDLTIVSGDSRGKTSFWNGKTGTLVDSYQTHKADVLAVAVAKDQQVRQHCLTSFVPKWKSEQRLRFWLSEI